MSRIIAVTAGIDKVKEHVRAAFRTAVARGEEIERMAKERLGGAVAAIDAAEAAFEAARKAEAEAWADVLAENVNSDIAIASVRDQLFNALGRPRSSLAMEGVFPEGLGTYSSGDERQQPVMISVLEARILAAASPRWSKAFRDGLVADLEAHRQAYQRKVDIHRPLEAAAQVAKASYRAAVRTAHTRLRDFKRDLQTLGLKSRDIDEIIPDGTRPDHRPPQEAPTKQAA